MSRTDWFCQQALGAKRKGSRVSLPCQLGGREMTQLWGGLSSVPAAPATGICYCSSLHSQILHFTKLCVNGFALFKYKPSNKQPCPVA